MNPLSHLPRALLVSALCLSLAPQPALAADPAELSELVDLGSQLPDVKALNEGLFPEDAFDCKAVQDAGYKCMGFKPAVRYSLPTASFKLGSAELPGLLRQQLDRFADLLRGKRGSGRVIRIEGHADASGTAALNQSISQRRAEAVRDYLVKQGAEQAMLQPVGMGAKTPKPGTDPFAADNRRVELARAQPPKMQ